MKPFTFSISDALRDSWKVFKRHVWFFLVMAFVSIVLGYSGNGDRMPLLIAILASIASVLWSIMWLKVSLAAARGDESKLSFAKLEQMVPRLREVFMIIGIGLLGGLLILCGLILLVIPGLYVLVRLSFASLVYLDRHDGIRASLRYSWNITKPALWTVALTLIVVVALYIAGIAFLGVGLLIAYPLAMMLTARLYVALSAHHAQEPVVTPATEVPTDVPEAEKVEPETV